MIFNLVIPKAVTLKNDVLSGITVALALIPEAIAFSFVAHVDPSLGLYAAFLMGIITAFIGGRPGMISGATGAIAVIFAPLVIQQTAIVGMDAAVGYLLWAVILMGLIQVLFGVLKLGKLVRLIPHPVMLGFVNGLAIVICKAQFSQFYTGTGESAQLLPVPTLGIMAVLIILTMGISHYLPRFTVALPASLVAIVVVSSLGIFLRNLGLEVYTVMDFVRNLDPSKTTIALTLPFFQLPHVPLSFETLRIIWPYAVVAAAVGLIESLMTLTLVDELTETRGQSNKESIGQGVANIANGFLGGMGGCAMIGQSMINVRAGGRGRASGITAALALLGLVVFGSSLIEQIPLAVLVGIMFMVVIATFEWSSFRIFKQIPRSDAFVLVLVSVVTVVVDLAVAVIAGVIVSALVFAWQQGKTITSKTNIKDGIKTYRFEGALFFGSVTSFKDAFNYQEDPDLVVLDFKHMRVHDHSGLEAIQNIANRYEQYSKKLRLVHVSSECKQLLVKAPNIVSIDVLEGLENWHIADDRLA